VAEQERDFARSGGYGAGQAQSAALLNDQHLGRGITPFAEVPGIRVGEAAKIQALPIFEIVQHEKLIPFLKEKSRPG